MQVAKRCGFHFGMHLWRPQEKEKRGHQETHKSMLLIAMPCVDPKARPCCLYAVSLFVAVAKLALQFGCDASRVAQSVVIRRLVLYLDRQPTMQSRAVCWT